MSHPPAPDHGLHIATFSLPRWQLLQVLALPTLGLIIGLAMAVQVLNTSTGSNLVIGTVGGFLIARTGVFLWRQSSLWGVRTELTTAGLVRHSGMHSRLIAFSDMEYVNLTGGHYRLYPIEFLHVFTISGEHLVYAGRVGFEFGRLLRIEHATISAPPLLDRWRMGGDLIFGAFAITPEGVQRDRLRVAWHNIDDVKVQERGIYLFIRDEWRLLTLVTQVPNARVFIEVLEHAINERKDSRFNTESIPNAQL